MKSYNGIIGASVKPPRAACARDIPVVMVLVCARMHRAEKPQTRACTACTSARARSAGYAREQTTDRNATSARWFVDARARTRASSVPSIFSDLHKHASSECWFEARFRAHHMVPGLMWSEWVSDVERRVCIKIARARVRRVCTF